jgi:Sulfatase
MPAESPNPRRPSLLLGAAHLAALWALAFAQPLFDLLGRNPDFFVARGNTRADILIFSFAFALLPPLAMLAVEAIAQRFSLRLRWGLHLAFVGLLAAALALQVLKEFASRPAGILIGVALLLGAAAALSYDRARPVRSLLDFLTPAPVVVLAIFLLFSDVSKLVLPQDEAKAASVRVASPVPVVIVFFDELPEGSLMTAGGAIDSSRFPSFAALARQSTWYRGATTVAGFTPRAVPALLTGRLPDTDELPIASDQPRNLFTLLGGAYRMKVMEDATDLCPDELCGDEGRSGSSDDRLSSLFSDLRVVSEHLLLPDGLRKHLPSVDQTFGDFATTGGASDEQTHFNPVSNQDQLAVALHQAGGVETEEGRFEAFIAGIGPQPRTLHFLDVESPHYPWNHLYDGRQYSNLTSEFGPFFNDAGEWDAPGYVTDLALQRHLFELGFDDRLLGQLIARLRRVGIWEEALVVVIADHGGAFIPGEPRRNPSRANLGQIAAIPTFIKSPGQRQGRITDVAFCTTDLLPKIARELGIRYPWERSSCPAGSVTVDNSPAGEVTLPRATVERERDAYVARIERLFGSGTGWGPLLRFGPNPGLVGRSAAALPAESAGEGSARFDDPSRLRAVRPGAAYVPAALLRGAISGATPGEALAVAVNGTIAAVGRSFDEDGETRFSIVVPPRYFRAGANRVVLYRVLSTGAGPRLERLGP